MNRVIRDRIAEFGRSIGMDELISDSQDLVVLAFDGAPPISLVILEEDSVAISAVLGYLPENNSEVLEELLASNLLWRDTDGATLSVERYSRQVFIARQLSFAEMESAVLFSESIERFLDLAINWAAVYERLISPEGSGHEGDLSPSMRSHERL